MSKAIKHTEKMTPGMTEYTVIFDWVYVDNAPELVVVLAKDMAQAHDQALELVLAQGYKFYGEPASSEDLSYVITFHGDVSSLVAE